MSNSELTSQAFLRLYETIKTLRNPGGCPWDRDQTPLSMRRDLIEETFEAVDAISAGDAPHAKEELGDVLLNTALIAYMYEQAGSFTIADSINELTDKLIRRHPHVFPESEGKSVAFGEVKDSGAVLAQWDAIKQKVEGREGESILDEVPKGFPPLLKAFKLQKKAAKKGFDWTDSDCVVDKIREELDEVLQAKKNVDAEKAKAPSTPCPDPFTANSSDAVNSAQKELEGEIGDLLFAVVNYARKTGVDPETALNATNQKFYSRFTHVEKRMAQQDIPMVQANLSKMDEFWDEAKALERGQ